MASVRTKYRMALATWVTGGLVLGLLAVEVSNLFIAPLLVLMAVLGVYTLNLRCPNCGHPVLLGLPGQFWGVRSWVPRRCASCGVELN